MRAKTLRNVTAGSHWDAACRVTANVQLRGVAEWLKGGDLITAILTPAEARLIAEQLLTAARLAGTAVTVATVSVTCPHCGVDRSVQIPSQWALKAAKRRWCQSCAQAGEWRGVARRELEPPHVVHHPVAVVDPVLQAEACARLLRWALGREDYLW